MNFLQYDDFNDFCLKNNCTPIQGLEILDKELEKIREGEHGSKRSVHS